MDAQAARVELEFANVEVEKWLEERNDTQSLPAAA
jgi:hypothetical protein